MQKIEIFDDVYITSDRCVWYSKKDVIILADLHLGLEASLREEGYSIPKIQKDRILSRLSTIIDKYQPETVVIDGDFKHSFGKNRKQEFYDLLDVIDYLEKQSELVIIRGNHDNYLKNIAEKRGIVFYENHMILDNITLTHGHKKIDDYDFLIIGHEHPSLKIRDEMGGLVKIPCFLYNNMNNVLISCAFSPFSGGRDIISAKNFISESINSLEIMDFHVYAVTDSGLMDFQTVGDIREVYPNLS